MKSTHSAPCAAVVLFCTLLLHAQTPMGEIQLDVRDSSGASMQANGTLENSASRLTRKFETDAQGHYTLQSLPYGRYRLQLSRAGFATQVFSVDVETATPVI